MSVPQPHARRIALAGSGLLLAGWLLHDASPAPDGGHGAVPSAPVLRPELVVADGAAAAGDAVATAPANAVGTASRPVELAAAGPGASAGSTGGGDAPMAMPAFAFDLVLDRVFAPARTRPLAEPSPAGPGTAAAVAATAGGAGDGQVRLGAGPAPAPASASGKPPAVATGSASERRFATEDDYYRAFRAAGRTDLRELERQAGDVLADGGEDCRKVAMLRALYEADHARALDYFTSAIATLPDRSRPEAVSVPAFAVGYLCAHLADPGVQVVVERIAWTGYLNASPELRHQAAAALLANAAPADLQRYAGYPAYQEMVTVVDRGQTP